MGVSWLSISLGWKQAIQVGLLPFLIVEGFKMATAVTLKMGMLGGNYKI
jgi:biotin transporter BioY